ncbi:pirin family protein [Luteipulveratus flavus]|uniref:Pirin family protein n=1 Tax=Luteipulveratus flavus TaxID=3031728 RepID=A0ABT6CAZ2_9MICO|nr:pirin family protein [Luteipulveratus sp. YIM 133296]MDF8266060.1 pirin family protein [Luteipulveratus sp. YIM 133296]
MSNPENSPQVEVCASESAPAAELLTARDVPLGGVRAMSVRRTLPQRSRSLIGAWCFADHYGPDDVSVTGGMNVAGHPHTGLQTVSWLFSGEIEHRDSIGSHAFVRPGQMNLMTAGHGIAHSEYSTASTTTLHGVQLWVALPERSRDTAPAFEHYEPPAVDVDGARVVVFLGSLLGSTSPVTMFTPLVGAEITLRPGQTLDVPVDPAYEHGVLVDTGSATVGGIDAKRSELVYQPTGGSTLRLRGSDDEATRVLVLGGEPFGEQILMWWNFVGRGQEEVAAYREEWERERRGGQGGTVRYGALPTEWEETIPAPPMPTVRLKLRG